jgi:hypothetical protein
VQTEGNERLLLEFYARIMNCEIIMYGFGSGVPMCICFGLECLCDIRLESLYVD